MNISSNNHSVGSQVSVEKLAKISKFLSLILRHQPETIGITLDQQGWAKVDTLIDLSSQQGRQIDRHLLEEVVAKNDKKRFTFNQDKTKIRANQGHSVPVNLALTPQQPPEYLYHGTASKFIDSIYSRGLLKQNRHHVHLSVKRSTAIEVGQRHGQPIVLKIAARKMHDAGLKFFQAKNSVWLTDYVAPDYIINFEQEL